MNTTMSTAGAYDLKRVQRILSMNGMTFTRQISRGDGYSQQADSESSHNEGQSLQAGSVSMQNGVRVDLSSQSAHHMTTQCYTVLVYELEVISAYCRQIGRLARYERLDLSKINKGQSRLFRTAIRAVYCLGLDVATVTLASVQGNARHVVIAIDPAPRLTSDEGTLFAEAVIRAERREHEELAEAKRAVFGMDPEFMLCRKDGKIVSAAQYLQRNGEAGYDGIRVKGKVVFPYVELRPKPSSEPKQLIIHLMQAMHAAAAQIDNPELSWIAGGMPKQGFRLGGHIHLSQISLTSRLLRVLDNYLALPLILIEADSTRGRRNRYGYLGDFRYQFHGGFEYRTLPSFIVTPRVTKGVLALARVIADHYRQLRQTPLEKEAVQLSYYRGEKKQLVPIVRDLWLDLENTSSYERYANYLNPFKQQLFALRPWRETDDLRKAWRIPPFHNAQPVYS